MKLILFISTIILPLLGCEYELENFNTYIKRMNLQRVELTDKKLENFLTELMLDDSFGIRSELSVLFGMFDDVRYAIFRKCIVRILS